MRITAPEQVAVVNEQIAIYEKESESFEQQVLQLQKKLDWDIIVHQNLKLQLDEVTQQFQVKIDKAKRRLAAENRHISELQAVEESRNETDDEEIDEVEPLRDQIAR